MEAQESSQSEGGGILGLFAAIFSITKSALSSTWNAVTKDGTLAAAGRQGADELGMALKAFPDSIQSTVPGTLWNPTQGEIAASRSNANAGPSENAGLLPSPSEIARGNSSADLYGPEQAKNQPLPSPSEIARDNGNVFESEKNGWVDREADRAKAKDGGNSENDQYERARGRVLPDEEKDLEKEREKDLGQSRCR